MGENKVSAHLHPPMDKEELKIIALRGHLLLVMGFASLSSVEGVKSVMLCIIQAPVNDGLNTCS